ncbi:MAG TPA: hypothetical protein PLJ21_01325 [Pseudobdellovibrionaceae bacterium]|nr:hypothetical protein [Pseudobdellovibrionaceae bacterium]
MKLFLTLLIATFLAPPVMAHGPHPIITAFNKTVEDAYDSALHKVGYSEANFDDLAGVAIQQDLTKKVRIVRYRFVAAQCAKDLEVYYKLDGSAYLAHRVVGCGN